MANAVSTVNVGPFVGELVVRGAARITLVVGGLSMSLLVVSVTAMSMLIVTLLHVRMFAVRRLACTMRVMHDSGGYLAAHLAQLEDPRHVEERHAIKKQVELLEAWRGNQGWGCVGNNFQNVTPGNGPGSFKCSLSTSALRRVNLLAVELDHSFTTGQAPDKANFMFFASALRPFQTLSQSLSVGKTKAEAQEAFRGRHSFAYDDASEEQLFRTVNHQRLSLLSTRKEKSLPVAALAQST